jgi:hypothetical protein
MPRPKSAETKRIRNDYLRKRRSGSTEQQKDADLLAADMSGSFAAGKKNARKKTKSRPKTAVAKPTEAKLNRADAAKLKKSQSADRISKSKAARRERDATEKKLKQSKRPTSESRLWRSLSAEEKRKARDRYRKNNPL